MWNIDVVQGPAPVDFALVAQHSTVWAEGGRSVNSSAVCKCWQRRLTGKGGLGS